MNAATDRLDERAAVEVMGWVPGGPEGEYWAVPGTLPDQGATLRMSRKEWRPTKDPFCVGLLLHELREKGLRARVTPSLESGVSGWLCTISLGQLPANVAAVWAPGRGLAVVCAALAWLQPPASVPGASAGAHPSRFNFSGGAS